MIQLNTSTTATETEQLSAVSTQALASLTPALQLDALNWQAALLPIVGDRRKRGLHLELIAKRFKVSPKTARKKFDRFVRNGLAGLIDRRAAGADFWNVGEKIGLSDQDKELVKEYCERYQRNNEAALRQLRHDWKIGVVTTTTALDVSTGYPKGWSERNLARFAPDAYALAIARQGRSAAAAHRPLVYMTRRNLYVGQFLLFDDIWHDHEVNILATQQRGRPLEFHGLDLSSAYKIGWGMRVRREVDGVHESLKTDDFRFLLASILFSEGYNPKGTTLIVEHGTTVIDEQTERLLAIATNGAIKVERSGMQGAAAHAGQYAGRAKGNFRIKAALESLGNLIHNEFAFLPGQTGKDRQHAPEQSYGLLKRNDALLLALRELSPERAQWLQWDLCTFGQFQLIAQEIYARINARTEHDLEGWDDRYIPTQSGQMRRLSPLEVWKAGKRELRPISPEVVAMIVGTKSGKERPVRNHQISFVNSEISGDPLRFDAHQLPPRSKFLCVLNPFDTDRLLCFNARGRYVATLRRLHSVDRGDVEAVQRAAGQSAKIESALLAPIRKRQLKAARLKLASHKNNARVLDTSRPFTAEEIADDRETRSRITDMRAFLPDPALLSPEERSGVSDWIENDSESPVRLVQEEEDADDEAAAAEVAPANGEEFL
jgi:hypothetical protein